MQGLAARYASLADELEEEVSEYRLLTAEQNDKVVAGLARSAIAILRERPDFVIVMEEQESPAPDYQALMQRLRAKRRR